MSKPRDPDYFKKYRVANPAYVNRHNTRTRNDWRKLKSEVFVHYFGTQPACAKCGISDIRVLSLHHVNGGGAKQRKELFGSAQAAGPKFYSWLKKNDFPAIDLQPVCANCHILIRYEAETKLREVA